MANFGDMQTRIARELRRQGQLQTEISEALFSAITHYEMFRFWFNEGRATTSTNAGNAYYGLPIDFVDAIGTTALEITIHNSTYPLINRSWDWINFADPGNSTFGTPTDWAYYQQQFRLYPIPMDSYPLLLSYTKRLPPLTDDASANAWTMEAEEMIRCRAKADLYENVIFDFVKADRMKLRERECFQALNNLTGRRAATGTIQASYL